MVRVLCFICAAALSLHHAFAQENSEDPLWRQVQGELKGKTITVGVRPENGWPFSRSNKKFSPGVPARYEGISVEHMKYLQEVFQFNIRWVEMDTNATPDDLVEGVGNGSIPVDVLPYIFTQTARRRSIARLSAVSPYDFTVAVVTKPQSTALNASGLVNIFDRYVWLLFAVSIAAFSFLRAWVDGEHNPDIFEQNKGWQVYNSFICTISIFSQQEVNPALTKLGHFLVVGTKVYALCIVGLFLAQVLNLTNRLDSQQREGIPSGIVAIQPGSSLVDFIEIKRGYGPGEPRWKENTVDCGSPLACLDLVSEGRAQFTVYDLPFVEGLIGEHHCGNLTVFNPAVERQNSAWVFPKVARNGQEGNPLAETFDRALILMRDRFEFNRIAESRLRPIREQCSQLIEDRKLQDPIGVVEVFILWLMFGIVITITVVISFVKCYQRDPNSEAQEPSIENRTAWLRNKVARELVNFGLNRAEREALVLSFLLDDHRVVGLMPQSSPDSSSTMSRRDLVFSDGRSNSSVTGSSDLTRAWEDSHARNARP